MFAEHPHTSRAVIVTVIALAVAAALSWSQLRRPPAHRRHHHHARIHTVDRCVELHARR
jgi:hypothetical protein